MNYIFLPVLIAALTLVGCSSAPKGSAFIDTTKELKPQEGLIKICRPTAFIMSAQSPEVFINGNLMADIVNSSILEIPIVGKGSQISVEFRPPGPNKFGLKVNLKPSEEKYIFVGVDIRSLLPIPVPTALIGVMSYRWEAANVDEALFKEKCSNLKTIRIRNL